MTRSRKFLAAAVLGALALVGAAFLATPFDQSARASASQSDGAIAADRIGAAFASLSTEAPNAALEAAAARLAKGDLGGCHGAAWPNIDAFCLTTADGAPAQPVRTITIGYQSEGATTVLVRVPAADLAAR